MSAEIKRVVVSSKGNLTIDFTGNIPSPGMNPKVKTVKVVNTYPSTNVYKLDCGNTEILYTGKRG